MGLVRTASFPQYVSSLISALLTSFALQTKPMRISLFSLLHKATKFRAKRSRNTTKAQRVVVGVGKEKRARGKNLREGSGARALPCRYTPYTPMVFPSHRNARTYQPTQNEKIIKLKLSVERAPAPRVSVYILFILGTLLLFKNKHIQPEKQQKTALYTAEVKPAAQPPVYLRA